MMKPHQHITDAACPNADISAYLDGELSPDEEIGLETHIAVCAACARLLNEQKSLLLALDSSLDDKAFELPKDFSRSVVANAESRVNGLRRPGERSAALIISAALLAITAIAAANSDRTLGAFGSGIEATFAIAATGAHFVYDLSLGTAVIFRGLFSNLVVGSPGAALLVAALFFGFLFIFSRLFFRQSGT